MNWNKAMTVNGEIAGTELGSTYVHEHLIVQPQSSDEKYIPYTLKDEIASTKEAVSFAQAGGGTLVEMTPIYFGRDPKAYRRIARAAGIHVICCTGFHKQEFLPPWFEEKSDMQLFDLLMKEVQDGLDHTGIRPGVIKLGTSFNTITPNEQRVIRAVARVHLSTGIPISTHCDKGTMGLEQIRLLEESGVDPARVLLCHVDIPKNINYVKELCRTGTNVCFDHVGRELADKDTFRVEMICRLLDAGFGKQITLAGDMGKKEYLPAYGGTPGFRYVLESLRKELEDRISKQEFEEILIYNPRRILAGDQP